MTNQPKNLTSLNSESVIRFSNPAILIFADNQKIILNDDLVKNINACLTKANLAPLANEGVECMFMSEGDANWKKGRLKLSAQVVLDEVDDGEVYKK